MQLQAKSRAALDVLGPDWLIIYEGQAAACTFSALLAGCSYLVRVAAQNAAGQGSFSMPLQVRARREWGWGWGWVGVFLQGWCCACCGGVWKGSGGVLSWACAALLDTHSKPCARPVV